jgi:hypothetical protein
VDDPATACSTATPPPTAAIVVKTPTAIFAAGMVVKIIAGSALVSSGGSVAQ